ncbi:MAG: shikimate dehydrogenase [Steroidobacteraceae bacterium]|nr:shikimate dehydrogenase [Steroidobacteraceae bacterium]
MNAEPDQYGVIGHPVAHSWSPFIHGLFARQTGEAVLYRLHDVAPADFRNYVLDFFSRGGRGLNVTVPHKVAAAELANELTPRAQRAGAVNTLALERDNRLLGDNTDGAGLVHDLRDNLGIDVRRRRVLLVGAGGATRGVLAPLLVLQPAELVVANRTPERAASLVADFADLGPIRGGGFGDIGGDPYDLVINATSASLSGELPAIPPSVIGAGTVCYDMAYSRNATPFLKWAQEHGCARAVQGWGMLVEQAAESFHLWRGVRPQTAPVLAALQERLVVNSP